MISRLIHWSIHNRFLVLLATLLISAAGVVAVLRTPVDAIPDLSDVQVIIKTAYPGQSPRVVEDQVTYPLTTTMMSVPGARVVRGYSFFGDSYVYVLFDDGTDLYWARSRVLEYLNQAAGRLPPTVRPEIGPDATGVGWIYQYALVDRSGKHDLAQLRALQDWFLKYELRSVRQRGRSGDGGRHGQDLPDRGGPGSPARLQPAVDGRGRRGEAGECRGRRRGAGTGRGRVHGARHRVSEDVGGFPQHSRRHHRGHDAGAARGRGADSTRPADAPRHRRAGRRGRGRGRRDRHALGQERAGHDPSGERETAPN